MNMKTGIHTNKYCLLLIGGFCCLLTAVYCVPANAQVVSNNLVLTWSTNTFAPPTYEGKPLPVYGSVIDLTVDPLNSSAGKMDGLNFVWFLNGDKQIFSSGKDRTRFMFRVSSSAGDKVLISVQIQDNDNNILAELAASIPIVSSEIVLYPAEENSNYNSSAINSVQTSPGQELHFLAAPYFFNIASAKELEYQWSFEGQPIIKVEDANRFSLKIDAGSLAEHLQKELSVFVENPKNRAQQASNKIDIVIRPQA
jgi:hypothetical protein